MSETIPITATTTITRDLAAGAIVSAQSTPPADPPWNATLALVVYPTADPTKKQTGFGVQVATLVKDAGNYTITVTPTTMPFAGSITI